MKEILSQIEFLRQEMHEVAMEKGIAHPDVLYISQKLDAILNECYKLNC